MDNVGRAALGSVNGLCRPLYEVSVKKLMWSCRAVVQSAWISAHRHESAGIQRPVSAMNAWRQVEAWLEVDVVWIPAPTDRHRNVLATLLAASGAQANLVPDAHLAALAIEHGLTLCSTDGDFGRFSDLRWSNPIAS